MPRTGCPFRYCRRSLADLRRRKRLDRAHARSTNSVPRSRKSISQCGRSRGVCFDWRSGNRKSDGSRDSVHTREDLEYLTKRTKAVPLHDRDEWDAVQGKDSTLKPAVLRTLAHEEELRRLLMTTYPQLPWDGGCRCGQVRMRISALPILTMACHCKGCQRMSASAFSLGAAIPSVKENTDASVRQMAKQGLLARE